MPIERQYFGCRVMQRKDPRAVSFFVFATQTSDVMSWSAVDRLEDRQGGIQRSISKARLRAIQRYFESDPLNTIPTAVVVAFLPGVARFVKSDMPGSGTLDVTEGVEWGVLHFDFDPSVPEIERPALIVDGQHRLYGMAQVGSEDLPVLVSALLDAEANEQAFQFVVINNKVTRVPSDLVRSLIVDFSEEALQNRLKTARVSLQPQALLVAIVDDEADSPFYQMVKWERRRGEGSPAVKPAAIEDSLKYTRRRLAVLDEDEDALIDFFFAMWSGVKDAYSELWAQVENRLFDNAGFKAFSEYLVDQLEVLFGVDYVDIMDTSQVREACRNLAAKINLKFWLAEWQLKSLDTSSGRETIKEDLRRIRQNQKDQKDWLAGLVLVGVAADETGGMAQ